MILNENPDHFIINNKMISFTRKDAVSFIAFKEGYAVYSTAGVSGNDVGDYGHVALGFAWRAKLKLDRGIELSPGEKEDWAFYKHHLKTIGEMGEDARKLAEQFLDGSKSPYDYASTSTMLKGRIWRGQGIQAENPPEMIEDEEEEVYESPLTDKVVAFWGTRTPDQLEPMIHMVVKILEGVGEEPDDFYFELGSLYYPYSSLVKGVKSKIDINKKYKIGSSEYTYDDLEEIRQAVHAGGPRAEGAKQLLCSILKDEFLEKNPELSGLKPADCDDAKNPCMSDPTSPECYEKRKRDGWSVEGGKNLSGGLRGEVEKGIMPSRELLRRNYGGAASKRMTRDFLQGKGPEPVTPTTSEPGQAAGMKGRTMYGLRAKTQKEIDAAWDDFRRKRPSRGILGDSLPREHVSFKEWLNFLENFFF